MLSPKTENERFYVTKIVKINEFENFKVLYFT